MCVARAFREAEEEAEEEAVGQLRNGNPGLQLRGGEPESNRDRVVRQPRVAGWRRRSCCVTWDGSLQHSGPNVWRKMGLVNAGVVVRLGREGGKRLTWPMLSPKCLVLSVEPAAMISGGTGRRGV